MYVCVCARARSCVRAYACAFVCVSLSVCVCVNYLQSCINACALVYEPVCRCVEAVNQLTCTKRAGSRSLDEVGVRPLHVFESASFVRLSFVFDHQLRASVRIC